MATINLLSNVSLNAGQESAKVTVSESSELVNLRLAVVKVGTADSQARLTVTDNLGRVKATEVVDGSQTVEVEVQGIKSDLDCVVACAQGSCRVSLDEVTGVEGATGEGAGVATADLADGSVTAAKLGALAVTTAKIDALAVTDAKLSSSAVTTAKIAAGAVQPTKLGLTGFKVLRFDGASGAGAITLTGAAIGDRVLFVLGTTVSSGVSIVGGTDFESTITVTDQIQQASASDLSGNDYWVVLIPATA